MRSCSQFSLMAYGAALHKRWGCSILALLVLLAGLNYWRRATYGLRRNADMLAVAVTVLYHSLVAFGIVGLGLDARPTDLWISSRPFLGCSEVENRVGDLRSRPLLVSGAFRRLISSVLAHGMAMNGLRTQP